MMRTLDVDDICIRLTGAQIRSPVNFWPTDRFTGSEITKLAIKIDTRQDSRSQLGDCFVGDAISEVRDRAISCMDSVWAWRRKRPWSVSAACAIFCPDLVPIAARCRNGGASRLTSYQRSSSISLIAVIWRVSVGANQTAQSSTHFQARPTIVSSFSIR